MNVAVTIGATHQITLHYPASQAQVVPAQLDPARYKIPARGRTGMFGFSCLDFMDNDQTRPFNGVRTVAFLTTSRSGVVYWTDVLFVWDAVISTTKPEGDPPATLTMEDRTFRYGFGLPGGGSGSESASPYNVVTPFAGGETSVALAYYDPVLDGFVPPTGSNLLLPAGFTTNDLGVSTVLAGVHAYGWSSWLAQGGIQYWGTASGISQTT